MNKVILIVVMSSLLFPLFISPGMLHGAIPASERAALIALDKAIGTGGSDWKKPPLEADGYSLIGTEGSWRSVTVTNDNVSKLDFFDDGVSGTLPPEIGDLTELVTLRFQYNNLSGSIPAEIGNLTKLDSLHLGWNSLTGPIPPEIGNLTQLTYLDIGFNHLTGSIPAEIGNLTKLESLVLSGNQMSGVLPAEMGNMTQLKYLWIHANSFSGSIPSEMGDLDNLLHFDIGDNQLSGSIPLELGNMDKVTRISLYMNQLSGAIPKELGNLSTLEALFLSDNNLTGPLPAELGNLSSLKYLELQSNPLTGVIPPELGNLGSLESLTLGDDQLTGTIPSQFGNLTNVYAISITSPQLTGPLPPELGQMLKLSRLTIENTNIDGSIPPELGNLPVLGRLWLPGNKLSGNIPSELGSLSRLSNLSLKGNNLSGPIPSSFTGLNLSNTGVDVGYNAFDGTNSTIISFLNQVDPDWKSTQTIPPTDLSAISLTTSSIRLSWTPIQFTANSGGYRVSYSTSPSGPWTFSGQTADKFASSFDVTGLTAFTTFYFTVSVRTDSHAGNSNSVTSTESDVVSAATGSSGTTYNLTVNSSPTSNTAISVSAMDNNGSKDGNTNFTRNYNSGTIVNLTAPPTAQGNNFEWWSIDGVRHYTSTVQVTMSAHHTALVYYKPSAGPYRIYIDSSPRFNAAVTVTPTDNNGAGNGTTYFSRLYDAGATVTLTAPAANGEKEFLNWTLNGTDHAVTLQIMVKMTGNITATAHYATPQTTTYKLTVQSTPDGNVPITVSPNDNDGDGDGNTSFTRTYDEDTVITLTAPATFNEKDFSKWTVDGLDYNIASIQVTMSQAQTAVVHYIAPEPPEDPEIHHNRSQFNFGTTLSSPQSAAQPLKIYNTGGGTLNWNASASEPWLNLSPASGSNAGSVAISVDAAGLAAGTYTDTITVSDANASNSPQTVNITLVVHQTSASPFGSFDSPLDGAVVRGSVAVTGWALDDTGVQHVKIYRDPVSGEGSASIYIGDAIFVEGARPGVETQYPEYPMNHKGGWGYMLLTNFFPGNGNGIYTLHARAQDIDGNITSLGTRTITCDNENAVKPFGALDTPTQGGTASGTGFIVWGWTLTPQPNMIPFDGSTINVWVDGVNIGNPVYNIYREDIATLFPGYANTDGAVGYFYLDTTTYENGVHTIQWTVKDDAANTDGIGSRYFSIDNGTSSRQERIAVRNRVKLPGHSFQYKQAMQIPPGDIQSATINQEPLLIRFPAHTRSISGYTVVGEKLYSLPVGSSIDHQSKIFTWQPGIGFIDNYRLIFILKISNGEFMRYEVNVTGSQPESQTQHPVPESFGALQ